MIIEKVKIKNFRGYKEETEIYFDSLTTFVGRNDIGKSTILEALDIFFNDGKGHGIIKMDKTDSNVATSSDEVFISVIFKNYPENVVVDSSVDTSLKEEYLLNDEGLLEVKKVYRNGTLKDTLIISKYPEHEKCTSLHSKSITDLKKITKELGISVDDNRKSSLFRKKILEYAIDKDAELTVKEISIKGTATKEIWEGINKYFPLFMLFQSDRENQDQDNVVQDPMKMLMSEIIKEEEIAKKLEEVFADIATKSKELSSQTLKKLEEMNTELAKELYTEFEDPSWLKAFKFRLETDNKIPANKRGSGVRRLILLNFFRAEAERRKNQRSVPNVIYAFEEPETSQHPEHQKILIEAFKEMATSDVNQVILTTHSPSIAKMLPIESLRLIKDEGIDGISVNPPKDNILQQIAEDLGIFTTLDSTEIHNVKLAICVEGKNDITFFKEINKHKEFSTILNIEQSDIIILPMGGSTLQFWVNENYLQKLNLKQLHIYDSDIGSARPHKYIEYVQLLNEREDCSAFETKVREFENFISTDAVKYFHPGIDDQAFLNWKEIDVPEFIAKVIHNDSDSNKTWENLSEKKQKDKKSKAKTNLNSKYLEYTLINSLLLDECKEEIKSWLHSGANLLIN